MKLSILGAGAMGLTAAAIAVSRGHSATLWSPSGDSTRGLGDNASIESSGALEGIWNVSIATTIADALTDADAVLLAADANGHRAIMDMAAPHMKEGVPFIVSAAHSLGGLYMARLMQARGISVPVVSFNTSPGTAHRNAVGKVDIRVIRARIEVAVTPPEASPAVLETCRDLFPATFEECASALVIGLLSNCNPVFHVPVCLLNIARIEHGETWAPYGETTPAVGRLMEALDRERVAIAAAFGAGIHSVNEHFHRSFRVPLESMAAMNATLHAAGRGPKGPKSTSHRYLMQDIPYGLVFAAVVARVAGVPAPVHDATILIAESALDTGFSSANTILDALDIRNMSRDELIAFARDARRPGDTLPQGTRQ